MSSTAAVARRTLDRALEDAQAFKALFDPSCYEQWEFAGSLRRMRPSVGDVEHVIITRRGPMPGGGLFAEERDLLMAQLDYLVERGIVTKHVYRHDDAGTPVYRWGEKNRGVDFRGFNHEIYRADKTNWGSKIAIATGPVEFSKQLVNALRRRCLRNHEGQVWQCDTDMNPVRVIECPTEQRYFELCGARWVDPKERG